MHNLRLEPWTWNEREWQYRDEPYQFKHNEYFRGWFAWVCDKCGIVKLGDARDATGRWNCELCRMGTRLNRRGLSRIEARAEGREVRKG